MNFAEKTQSQTDEILDRKTAAKLIGICLTTLGRLDIPRIKLRRRVFYKHSAILQYLDENTEINVKEED